MATSDGMPRPAAPAPASRHLVRRLIVAPVALGAAIVTTVAGSAIAQPSEHAATGTTLTATALGEAFAAGRHEGAAQSAAAEAAALRAPKPARSPAAPTPSARADDDPGSEG
ncbi:MAG: hypothetical protein IPH03_10010 [Tetrasphaera sp.]|nr:hypothetical protein [Tetrasphaera sp.]